MPGHDIVVVGASAGGVEAMRTLAADLPAGLPAAVFVVLHMSPESPGLLAPLLAKVSRLPAEEAAHGVRFETGRIYVARPDHHLMLDDGRLRVVRGPKENRARPALDPLFRSAALAYGPRVVGVVLTGSLGDGAAGLAAIKKQGGVAVVQDPRDALFPSMPRNALMAVDADHVVPMSKLGTLLSRVVLQPAAEARAAGEPIRVEVAMGAGEPQDIEKLGGPSPYSCPECGGVLNEVDDSAVMRFRCRVGHAYTSDTLAADQDDHIEDMLWAAQRALEESAGLKRRLADRMRRGGKDGVGLRLDAGAEQARKRAEDLRRLLMSLERPAEQ